MNRILTFIFFALAGCTMLIVKNSQDVRVIQDEDMIDINTKANTDNIESLNRLDTINIRDTIK